LDIVNLSAATTELGPKTAFRCTDLPVVVVRQESIDPGVVAKAAVKDFGLSHSSGWEWDNNGSSKQTVKDPVLFVHANVFGLRSSVMPVMISLLPRTLP